MSEKKRVVVCDDDTKRVSGWTSRLESILPKESFEVTPLSPSDFGAAIRALHERIKAGKAGGPVVRQDEAQLFDEADILIIDSDLTPDPDSDPGTGAEDLIDNYLVGEFGSNVARLAREYSTVGLLVVVNHIFKQRTFDLTLTRFAELPADAYIAAPDLDSRGLWFGETDGSFRPWIWPNMSTLAPPSEMHFPGVTLESPLSEVLGLDDAAFKLLETRQLERLFPDVKEPNAATLRDIANSPTFGLSLQPDTPAPDSQLLRIAKSGLRRWLDYVVLPSQNLFVDLPHLLQERPWLVQSRSDPNEFAQLVSSSWDGIAVLPDALAPSASSWLGRPVWRVDMLPPIDVAERLDVDDLVFCEDISEFRLPSAAREFASDIDGNYKSRFVAKLADVEYTPVRRLFAT